MSGSPAWLQRDGKLYVTGIFHEGATAHDTILVTLLEDFLRTDGTLDHLAIPPCYSRYHGEGYGESIPDDRFE